MCGLTTSPSDRMKRTTVVTALYSSLLSGPPNAAAARTPNKEYQAETSGSPLVPE